MMAKEVFNYYKDKISESDYVYYGFHLKDGRYHIDTKRLKKLGVDGSFPSELFSTPRNTHYFIPKHKYESDYKLNILLTALNRLARDWNEEYKEAISKIKTAEDVYQESRVNRICFTSNMDDLDDIDVEARLDGIRRMAKYDEIIKGIHLQYLQRIFIEYFRALNLALKQDSQFIDDVDFSYGKFIGFIQSKFNCPKKANPVYSLPHYRYFYVLNKLDNFLKHNTVKSYNELANNPEEKDEEVKQFLASFVVTPNETKKVYTNGTYAGYWIKITTESVNEMIDNLRAFSCELCELVYDEKVKEVHWNSDESLLRILIDNFFSEDYLY